MAEQDPGSKIQAPGAQVPGPASRKRASAEAEKVLCERCGVEMFRMHAVWRCPGCGYKTDCCGW
jgi:rubrerythrin